MVSTPLLIEELCTRIKSIVGFFTIHRVNYPSSSQGMCVVHDGFIQINYLLCKKRLTSCFPEKESINMSNIIYMSTSLNWHLIHQIKNVKTIDVMETYSKILGIKFLLSFSLVI